jgi:hypothetical protein
VRVTADLLSALSRGLLSCSTVVETEAAECQIAALAPLEKHTLKPTVATKLARSTDKRNPNASRKLRYDQRVAGLQLNIAGHIAP